MTADMFIVVSTGLRQEPALHSLRSFQKLLAVFSLFTPPFHNRGRTMFVSPESIEVC